MIKSSHDPTEHPSDPLDPKSPLSLTEKAVFGHDAVRCKETGRVFERGSGSLSYADQTALFKLQAEIAKREAAEAKAVATDASPLAVPARWRGAEPV
jgi:hypothetical protein